MPDLCEPLLDPWSCAGTARIGYAHTVVRPSILVCHSAEHIVASMVSSSSPTVPILFCLRCSPSHEARNVIITGNGSLARRRLVRWEEGLSNFLKVVPFASTTMLLKRW